MSASNTKEGPTCFILDVLVVELRWKGVPQLFVVIRSLYCHVELLTWHESNLVWTLFSVTSRHAYDTRELDPQGSSQAPILNHAFLQHLTVSKMKSETQFCSKPPLGKSRNHPLLAV